MMPMLMVLPVRRVLLPGWTMDLRVGDVGADVEELGVALERAGSEPPSIHDVGTAVTVMGRRPLAGDGAVLRLRGERRFAIGSRHVAAVPGRIEVEFLEDDVEPSPEAQLLVPEVRALLRRYLAVLAESGYRSSVLIEIFDDPVALSHQVAALTRLSVPERQELLELDTTHRLRREARLLEREIDLLERVMGTG